MPVEIDNEVLQGLMLRLRNSAPIAALVATVTAPAGPAIFFEQLPTGGGGFPKIIVQNPGQALRGTDFEGWEGGRFRLIFDIFGPDISALRTIAGTLDREITIVQPVDTGNFVLTILRRTGEWRTLGWRDQEQGRGNPLTQLTSDWLLVAGRKQGA